MPRCPECGYEAENEFKFCPMCGNNFQAQTEGKPDNNNQSSDDTIHREAGSTETHKYYKVVNGLYEYPKAPIGKRFVAYLIDGLILFTLSLPSIALFTFGFLMNPNHDVFDEDNISGASVLGGMMSLWGLFLLIIPSIYYFIKDGLKNGQSFGKRALGLMVIDTQKNQPCRIGKSAFRNLISSLIIAIPFLNFLTVWIEPIMVLAREDGRKAADLVASTQVIDAYHFERV